MPEWSHTSIPTTNVLCSVVPHSSSETIPCIGKGGILGQIWTNISQRCVSISRHFDLNESKVENLHSLHLGIRYYAILMNNWKGGRDLLTRNWSQHKAKMEDFLFVLLCFVSVVQTILVILFVSGLLYRLKKSKRICVLVIGDVGRSPRMQNHAISLAENGYIVDFVGQKGMIRVWRGGCISVQILFPWNTEIQ